MPRRRKASHKEAVIIFGRREVKEESPLYTVSNSFALALAFVISTIIVTCWTYEKSHNFHILFDEMVQTSVVEETDVPENKNEIIVTEPPISEVTTVVGYSQAQSEPVEIIRSAEEPATTTVPSTESFPQTVSVEEEQSELMINLNTATVEELMQLKGIGQVKAEAIIEYRNKYLCFIDKIELTDVDGIGEKIYEQIKDNVYIGTTIITMNWNEPAEVTTTEYIEKININAASLYELMTLNGIGEAKAEAIIAYREAEGDFVMIEEIMDVKGIGEGIFEKINNYISIK